ncbi:tRNA methyltransferase 61 [Dermatophagoides pteronyssinus]|uniref:tRNA methyltransferase 61 n=1 Tax=Dermatophagoides pteronyssinus TaxID=6956 RepID=UPI003F6752AC
MSFCRLKTIIDEGDTVVVYLTPRQMYRVKVDRDEVFQTRLGALRMEELIGKPYGSRIQCNKGNVLVLDMTPEIWTLLLPHRTQILYGPDIGMILMNLELRSGSFVIEAGTGSGSLSHSIARTIAPNGKLFTFDFHQKRVEIAREEFREHQIDHIVSVQQRDVCRDGFKFPEQSESESSTTTTIKVDAVFLDLPNPWEAIESAQNVMKNGAKICCFSPCIEQVQRSCQMLTRLNFSDIETIECVLRPYELRKASYEKLKLNQQFETSNGLSADPQESMNVDDGDHHHNRDNDNTINGMNKKIRTSEDDNNDNDNEEEEEKNSDSKIMEKDVNKNNDNGTTINYWVTYMNTEITGHSGFLTFATNFIC